MTQDGLWIAAGAAAALALISGLAEWRRTRRRDLDNPGCAPWRGLQAAAIFATVLLVALALKAGP